MARDGFPDVPKTETETRDGLQTYKPPRLRQRRRRGEEGRGGPGPARPAARTHPSVRPPARPPAAVSMETEQVRQSKPRLTGLAR